jgi:hypothetical protein
VTEMEERVARAIFDHRDFYGSDPQKPAWVVGGNSTRQGDARSIARAAIEAMRKPTEEMVAEGIVTGSIPWIVDDMQRDTVIAVWRAMNEAALEPPV